MSGARFVSVDPDAPAFAAFHSLLEDSPLVGWSSLHHVDMPVWEPNLFEPPKDSEYEAIIPIFSGRGGHPVLLNESLNESLLALNPESDRLDYFLKTRKTARIETPYPIAVENWNTGP